MINSLLQGYDLAVKSALYNKFASILEIDTHYEIDLVNLVDNSIIILGNFASGFPAGDNVDIQSSTDNDGTYTVVSVAYADGKTTIVLTETLSSTTADGTIYRSEETNINLGVFQFPKEGAQRFAAEKRGETFLEFINFWRMGASFSWARNRTPLARRGMWLDIDGSGKNTTHVKAVPIDLNYNAWFWSKDLDKIYKVIEDYVFWQQNDPKISVLYNDIYELRPDIHFGEIVDESTVAEQYQEGIIYVYKMPIKVDGWVLKGDSFKTIHKIKVTFYDKNDITDYSEIIVEDTDQDTEMEAALRFFSRAVYNISSVDRSAHSIGIVGNFEADFAIGDKITIWNSSTDPITQKSNDGTYTIASDGAVYVGDKTIVVVDEVLNSSIADGTIYK